MRQSSPVEPEAFIEPTGIDDKRVPLPAANGVSVITGREFLWMRPAVHVDGAKRMGPALIEDQDALEVRHVDKLNAVGSEELARSSGWLASCMRFELIGPAEVVHRPCPWLKRHLTDFGSACILRCRFNRDVVRVHQPLTSTIERQPHSGLPGEWTQIDFTIRTARRRTGRRVLLTQANLTAGSQLLRTLRGLPESQHGNRDHKQCG